MKILKAFFIFQFLQVIHSHILTPPILPTEHTRDQQIIQIKNFSNYLIEQNETVEFELQNYFSGALLDYDLQITNLNGSSWLMPWYEILINLTPPSRSIHYQLINNQTHLNQIDPFPSSTILLSENNGTTLTMYMVDRNFIFYKYDASQYANGVIKEIYRIQLNTSIVNESCHDLTLVNYGLYQQSVIMFCKSEIYYQSGDVNYNVYTIVQVDLNIFPWVPPLEREEKIKKMKKEGLTWDFVPTVRYISFKLQSPVEMDFMGGIKYIGQENRTGVDNSIMMLFLANQVPGYFTKNYQQAIVMLNFSQFIDMAYQNITYTYNLQSPMKVKYWIKFDDSLSQDTVSSYEIVSLDPVMVGLVFEHVGVLLCQFTYNDIYIPLSWASFYPSIDCSSSNTSQFIPMDNALSLYANPQDPSFFFISQSNPPGVIEVNIDDPYNAYVFQSYSLHIESPAFVGLHTMTTNKNVIVHLMLDVETNQQVLRLYNRNASYYNVAKYNYILPPKSHTNFFMFPSFYQNNLFFRDEQRINVTLFFDYKLTLDGTNDTYVSKLKYQIFQVNLTIHNEFTSISSTFEVTFVDEMFTQAIVAGYYNDDRQIFYNCGDDSFQYRLSDLFDGPNFDISYDTKNCDDCQEGYCYFDIVNQGINKQFESNFTLANCDQTFIYPDIDSISHENEDVILICIDTQKQIISSFKLVQENQTVEFVNSIEIPQLKFLYAGANIQERGLFVVAEITDQEWFDEDNEVHFFSIQSQVLWKNFTESAISLEGCALSDLNIFKYNANINKGLMVSYQPNQTSQVMLYFDVNGTKSQFNVITQTILTVNEQNQTMKVAISQEGFVYALQANQVLNIFQIIQINSQYSFVLLKSKILDNGQQIPIQMDIHENFFIVYYGVNEIYVYDIQNYIELVYRMKLPLYEEYSGFRFSMFSSFLLKGGQYTTQVINNDYFDKFLSIMMVDPDYHGVYSLRIFIFSLDDFQHNSLVMTQDVTDFFYKASPRQMVLTGNSQKTDMVLISDLKIALYDVQFFNFLILRNDTKFRQQLIEKCSTIKCKGSQEIATIAVKAQTLFNQLSPINYFNNRVKLRIYSENQGLAITPTPNLPVQKNVFMSYGDSPNTNEMSLSLESYLEGYNMDFDISCTFFDENGHLHSCADKGVQDYTHSAIYSFYIEFVTQIRQVVKSFSLGNLFVMFDTLNMITVQTLTNSNLDLDNINGMALDMKHEYPQSEKLGCNIEGFINIYQCAWIDEDPENAYTLYLAIYECRINQSLQLRLAKIQVYDGSTDIDIKVLDNQQNIRYRLIDIDRSNITIARTDLSLINVTIAVTVEIPDSTSNILLVQNLTVDIKNNITHFHPISWTNANTLDKDTFKVKQVLKIPNSDLIIIVDELFGIYIYDLDGLQILKEFDLKKDNAFQDQNEKSMGPLQVFTAAGNWPYEIHILTNYGIFVYNFGVDLTIRNEIFPYYDQNLEPIRRKVIRYQFDDFNNELASNDYGYSFLMTKTTSKTSFDIYLGVISYYSSESSRLFRIMKVASDQQCLSLNQESFLAGDNEDELTVSFVCNTQLFIVKTCLKPRLMLNMQDYLNVATKQKNGRSIPGALQYNQFNITVTATNEYNQSGLNQGQVSLILHQKTYPESKYPEFYLICTFILCTAISLIMLLAIGGKKVNTQDEKRVGFIDAQIPRMSMSFSENRASTMANHNSFVPGGMKLLNLQNLNKLNSNRSNSSYLNQHFDSDADLTPKATSLQKEETNFASVFNKVNDKQMRSAKKTEMPRFEMLSSEVQPLGKSQFQTMTMKKDK